MCMGFPTKVRQIIKAIKRQRQKSHAYVYFSFPKGLSVFRLCLSLISFMPMFAGVYAYV